MKRLIKIDRNGSKHYEGHVECPKCGGSGMIVHHMENGVPSYNWTDSGVCWKCGGSGKVLDKWIERTPEYQAKLDARRQKKEEERQKKMQEEFDDVLKESLQKWGFTESGLTFLFLGNTFEQKDAIKATGAKFNQILGWHIDHKVEGFEFLPYQIDVEADLQISKSGKIYDINMSRSDMDRLKEKEFRRLHPEQHTSEYKGEIKERLKGLKLTLMFETTFENQRPAKYRGCYEDIKWFYSFKDEDGNIFTWIASSPMNSDIQKGDTVILDGTVKEHKEYKGDKQTVLTRCKIQGVA